MHDERARDELLARLQARVATLEARAARRRLPRRFLPLALLALLVLLTPVSLLAASPFNDLTGGAHDANIGLIYDAGITKGCVPNVSYCPTGNVTREEMASFLARTAGLGTNPPVVNAKTAQTAQSATIATTATNAINATTATHAGYATSADTATTATTAGNANTVGGFAPNGLVQVFSAANSADPARGEVAVPVGIGDTTIIIFSFTAPAAGYVLLTTSLAFFAPPSGCPCIMGYHSQVGTAPPSAIVTSPIMVTTLTNGFEDTGAMTWTFPVAAGANTFSVIAYRVGGATGTMQARPAVTGIYTPFGGAVRTLYTP